MSERNISFTALKHQWQDERDELLPILEEVFASGKFVGGEYIHVLEKSGRSLRNKVLFTS